MLTVAIIGAADGVGARLAKGIAKGPYRILLIDETPATLPFLAEEIFAAGSTAMPEILRCCKDASWEADIIVMAIDDCRCKEVAVQIREVATQKPVIVFKSLQKEEACVQQMLPFSKVTTVTFNDEDNGNVWLSGTDEYALQIAGNMVKQMGLKPEYAAEHA